MATNLKRDYFNDLASRWDDLPAVPDAPAKAREFVERILRPGAPRILDVGCGTGILLPHLLELFPSSSGIVELDLAERMLTENGRKFPDERVLRVCADARNLPFADGCFDLVLCFGVLPHLGDAASAVWRLFRFLRPAGAFAAGHLMGSAALNAFHASLGEPVAGDTLLPAEELAGILRGFDARHLAWEESSDWYFVSAEKPAS
jgi:ubiquinone/menaquinone biosynthesis C-methylase UbiE